ncbi:short-chain dehydrogenase [Leptospira perolatii]|uniref:Short-chain dehydrogenase n=1 Tax=Leptospira perolatii TaxID=2023191 RepID=A0A2M9ZL96_9LEPT|nr:SDR family oxidoreductase [Leptospira perolatii]PJZ70289.1 short-chain dehydrogenase [Leptospira perolatii]PJZ72827.1 short-chain dehydrogenase [Leptospira perolatii]
MTGQDYSNVFSLKGKVAIITGGAGLLGQEFCNGLASFGASVAIVDLNLEKATEISRNIKEKFKIESLPVECDVTSKSSVASMVRRVVDHFGKVDILHNNAAGKTDNLDEFFASFEDYSLDQWRKIMAVNVDGMFLVAQEVGKQMISQGSGGSVIQTASIYGVSAPDNRIYEGSYYLGRKINTPAVYSASKAAVIGLTKYLSTYWADHKIRVNTLTPGGTESGQNEEFVRRYSNRVPLNRMAVPSDMVGALIYLASDASSYLTGQNIIVDGGLTVW